MSEPIKAGDLVVVVRASSCGCPPKLGHIFRVLEVRPPKGRLHCKHCKADLAPDPVAVERHAPGFGSRVWELNRLKRIPPLDELESEKHKEGLTA